MQSMTVRSGGFLSIRSVRSWPSPASVLRRTRSAIARGTDVERAATLAKARARNPERFSTNLDPKILATPDAAWINKPTEAQEEEPRLAA